MNIFVSYGHKDYPDFVKKFVLDLGENNIVWTDEKIKLGSPWVQEIDDAIRQSDVFLFLLASDAIRKDSYCYGEIIYAKNIKKKIVVLVLENITMPTIIAQWQYFSMENVFDICGNFMVEEYNAMFPKFLLKLEQCLLQTEESLHSNISSLKYFNNMQRLKSLMNECFIDFALLDLTDKWLKSGKTYFALLGGAGSGKSTAATVMYDRYKKKAAIHFCNYANEKTTDTRIILQSIAKGLTDISSEYKDILSTTFNFERDINGLSTDDIFEELFLKPLDILSDSNTYIIILDGIDEISQKQKREFYRILFKRTSELSGKLKIFLTSRKDSEFVTALYANGAEILDKYEHFNHNSIKNYVNKWFSDNSIFYDDICLDNITNVSHFFLTCLQIRYNKKC